MIPILGSGELISFKVLIFLYFVLQILPSAPLAGDTDYSDPFDARVDHRPEADFGPVPCENNSYMEPYEAQRVITGQWDRF